MARYLSGQILGQLFGQAAGGVLGDLLGWRNVFFVLAGMFALATAGLVFELIINPQIAARAIKPGNARGFIADYAVVLSNPFARIVIIAAFIEGALAWGAFAYIGADLHLRFGLTYTLVGLTVGCFGIGGLIYAALVKFLCAGSARSALPSAARHSRRRLCRACRRASLGGWRRSPRPRSGSASTCCTTRCRPTPRR